MKLAAKFIALLPIIFLLWLTGCGGGSGGGSTEVQHVGVFVTDGFSNAYSSVLITLYKIEVSSDGINYTTVYSNTGGTTIDVAHLSSVLQLIGAVTLPAGTYTQTRITLSDTIAVVPTGSATSSTLSISSSVATVNGGLAVITINTPQTITDNSNIVADFDLPAYPHFPRPTATPPAVALLI